MTGPTIDEFAATLAAIEAYAERRGEHEVTFSTRSLLRLIDELTASLERLRGVTRP